MSLPVLIIGASFSGLTLALGLARRGIQAVVFDQKFPSTSNHGVALQDWALWPLLSLLDTDLVSLRKALAVDAATGGEGRIEGLRFDAETGDALSPSPQPSSLRAHRPSLLKLLSQGVDVRTKRFKSFETSEKGVEVVFEDGSKSRGCLLVGADGVHSKGAFFLWLQSETDRNCKVRSQLLPQVHFKIHEYAVYYGQQHLKPDDDRYKMLGDSTELTCRIGSTLLGVKVNERTRETLRVGWTYSQPALRGDALLQPERTKDAAAKTPLELIDVMAETRSRCAEPFARLLDTERQEKEDRIVHWLQRTVKIPLHDLLESAQHRVALVGDAAHAAPLLTADGANHALLDGLALGEMEGLESDPIAALRDFYSKSRSRWQEGQDEADHRLREMHSQ